MKNTIPLFLGRIEDEAIINPDEEYEYEKSVGIAPDKKYPESCIICFQDEVIQAAKRFYKLSLLEKMLDCELFELKSGNKTLGIIKSGIGAPCSALITERLIARGFVEFIIIGIAGSLDPNLEPGSLVLVEKSLRDEGTSYHYYERGSEFCYADVDTTKRIKKNLEKDGIRYDTGSSWTTDAGYRETKKKAEHFRSIGIKAVDMESSALFAISKFRGVRMGCIFSVSDSFTASLSWNPHFHLKEIVNELEKALKVSVKTLS